jgi:hypothetical protein
MKQIIKNIISTIIICWLSLLFITGIWRYLPAWQLKAFLITFLAIICMLPFATNQKTNIQ